MFFLLKFMLLPDYFAFPLVGWFLFSSLFCLYVLPFPPSRFFYFKKYDA